MSDTVLVAESGRSTGSAASRRMRGDDIIPAIVYGLGMDPISISVVRRDLRQALSGSAGMNTVLDLTIDGTVYPSIIKDLQRHPTRRTVSHIDFIQINLTEQIRVNVPVRLVGEAHKVMNNNGLVDASVDSIEVETTPRQIPDEIVIDISEMTMDSIIRIGDIALPDGVVATADPENPVVTVLVMRAEAEAIEEADAETAEAAAAEGDDGAATAATADEAEGSSDATAE